eukprot:GEZU01012869.1.p1 GENE.GEZU01012869.1~~GEZU01012869.1.p1  ORF type:complete len:172 (-),score=32.93 GEZU01012869.1:75-590(-)
MWSGVIGAGNIGKRVISRLKPFDVQLFYTDLHRLDEKTEQSLGVTFIKDVRDLVARCDVVTVHLPLTPETDGLFNRDLLMTMKKGSYLINTARGRIVDTKALVEVMESGHLAGYAGDVWYPEPAPADHPWRKMPNHALVPHYSGSTLEAQKRYSNGTKECLENYFKGRPQV